MTDIRTDRTDRGADRTDRRADRTDRGADRTDRGADRTDRGADDADYDNTLRSDDGAGAIRNVAICPKVWYEIILLIEMVACCQHGILVQHIPSGTYVIMCMHIIPFLHKY